LNTTKDRVEIGLAGALGAGMGLMAAHAFGMSVWAQVISFFGSGFAAGFCYKPQQIIAAIGSLLPKKRWSPKTSTLCIIGYVMIAILAACAPALLFLAYAVPDDGSLSEWGTIGFCIFFGMLMGSTMYMFGMAFNTMVRDARKRKKGKSARVLPIMRRLPYQARYLSLIFSHLFWKFPKMHVWQKFAYVTAGILLMQACGFIYLIIIMVDVMLSVYILCASTQRLAAMCGGWLGTLTGLLIAWNTAASQPAAFIAIGMIAGFCSGPLIYMFAQALAAPVVRRLPVTA
jgi:hypothetical protein